MILKLNYTQREIKTVTPRYIYIYSSSSSCCCCTSSSIGAIFRFCLFGFVSFDLFVVILFVVVLGFFKVLLLLLFLFI